MSVLSEAVIKELKQLKELNAHGEAYLLAAQTLGLTALANQFAEMNKIKQQKGGLPPELVHKQYDAYQRLMLEAITIIPLEEYKEFYMCF